MEEAGADLQTLHTRMAAIGAQLDADWAAALRAQLHLDRDTGECAYWHAGYHQALFDVLDLVSDRRAISDSADTSSLSLAVG
ncbi:MAG: hypothetical protein ABWZ86_07850 [Hyphomicrobium sp.]